VETWEGVTEIARFIVDTGSGTGLSSGSSSCLSVLGPTGPCHLSRALPGPASCTRPYSLASLPVLTLLVV